MAKLSDTRIRGIKPRAKRFKLFDGEGLFLIVTPQGGRWWRQRYRWAGKEQSFIRKWTPDHTERVRRRLDVHFFPWLARKFVGDVTEEGIITCVRRMEDRNIIDTARRALAERARLTNKSFGTFCQSIGVFC